MSATATTRQLAPPQPGLRPSTQSPPATMPTCTGRDGTKQALPPQHLTLPDGRRLKLGDYRCDR